MGCGMRLNHRRWRPGSRGDGTVIEAAILLLFFLHTNGPTTVSFDSMAQCQAAEPIIVQNYKEIAGVAPVSRCVALKLPAARP